MAHSSSASLAAKKTSDVLTVTPDGRRHIYARIAKSPSAVYALMRCSVIRHDSRASR